jgi:hypothetical protein
LRSGCVWSALASAIAERLPRPDPRKVARALSFFPWKKLDGERV